jgi:hypothetical protein
MGVRPLSEAGFGFVMLRFMLLFPFGRIFPVLPDGRDVFFLLLAFYHKRLVFQRAALPQHRQSSFLPRVPSETIKLRFVAEKTETF